MKTLFAWAFLVPMLFSACKKESQMSVVVCNPRLVIVAGQSNAIGVGPGDALPQELIDTILGANIFYHDAAGTNWNLFSFQPLKYNLNNEGSDGLTTPGYRGHFGIELRLLKLLVGRYDGPFNLLKVGAGGTSLHQNLASGQRDWSPLTTGEFFDVSQGYETAGVQAAGGLPPVAYVWIQGENDANAEFSGSYEANLTEFITLKRQQFEYPDMPFVICRLGNMQTSYDITQHNIIRSAQENVAANVDNCYLVNFDGMPVQDGVHYTYEGYDTGAHRVFNTLKKIIPITLKANTPGCFIAKETKLLADAGFEPGDIRKIILPGKPNSSFNPSSTLNTLTQVEAGKAYYIIPGAKDVDQRTLFYP